MRKHLAAVCVAGLAFSGASSVFAESNQAPEGARQVHPDDGSRQPHVGSSGQSADPQAADRQSADVQRTGGTDDFASGQVTPEQAKEMQQQLKSMGLYQGNIDGIVGPQTRSALREYQSQRGLTATGMLNGETARQLGIELQVGGPGQGMASAQGQADARQPVAGRDSIDTARGAMGAENTAGVGTSGQPELSTIQLSNLDSQQTEQLQQSLQEMGLYRGEIDGVAGPQTRSALSRYFQQRAQLAQTGKLTQEDAEVFGLDPSEIEPVGGIGGDSPMNPKSGTRSGSANPTQGSPDPMAE